MHHAYGSYGLAGPICNMYYADTWGRRLPAPPRISCPAPCSRTLAACSPVWLTRTCVCVCVFVCVYDCVSVYRLTRTRESWLPYRMVMYLLAPPHSHTQGLCQVGYMHIYTHIYTNVSIYLCDSTDGSPPHTPCSLSPFSLGVNPTAGANAAKVKIEGGQVGGSGGKASKGGSVKGGRGRGGQGSGRNMDDDQLSTHSTDAVSINK
jgi:uncharacterized membrane protein YgcG